MKGQPATPQWQKSLFVLLLALSCTPLLSAPVALACGIAFGLAVGSPWPAQSAKAAKRLLQISVLGLGFGLGIGEVWQAGRAGLLYTLVGISATMLAGYLLGKALGVASNTATLLSFGTAICGGSAIAALAPIVGAEEEEIAVSVATVFSLNAVALFLFPVVGHSLGLTERQFGLWAALAIHDTSSVVGAGAQYGAQALAVATTVKLARAAWIAPVSLAMGWVKKVRGKGALPWFIVGFVVAAALRSALPQLGDLWALLYALSRRALVVTLFLIGTAMTRRVLQAIGARPLLHGVALWLLVGSATLLAILQGLVR